MTKTAKALLSLLALPPLVGAADPQAAFVASVMAGHAAERAAVGVPDMAWDPALAVDAQRWATHLARTGSFEHEDEVSYDLNVQGENLWMGTRGAWAPSEMVDGWRQERRHFQPGTFPHVSRTGALEDVGHYTQMVWRQTGRVGCAMSSAGGMDYLVCRYARTGNVEGERVF